MRICPLTPQVWAIGPEVHPRAPARFLGLYSGHSPAITSHLLRLHLRSHLPTQKRELEWAAALGKLCAAWRHATGQAAIRAGARHRGADAVSRAGCAGRLAGAAGERVA